MAFETTQLNRFYHLMIQFSASLLHASNQTRKQACAAQLQACVTRVFSYTAGPTTHHTQHFTSLTARGVRHFKREGLLRTAISKVAFYVKKAKTQAKCTAKRKQSVNTGGRCLRSRNKTKAERKSAPWPNQKPMEKDIQNKRRRVGVEYSSYDNFKPLPRASRNMTLKNFLLLTIFVRQHDVWACLSFGKRSNYYMEHQSRSTENRQSLASLLYG